MAAWFVAAAYDILYQRRFALSNPTQNEKRGFDATLVEQIEQARGVGLDTTGIGIPIGGLHDISERLHLKIIFYIHREDIPITHTRVRCSRGTDYPS